MTRQSPCKVNLLLNILRRRPDGFHELETVMQPVALHDELEFSRGGAGVDLSCNHPTLPTDHTNLVHRAATAFLAAIASTEGLRIHLRKHLPLAAGLGGGSANAACTLRALNDLFGQPLAGHPLHALAAKLGSDVPFFLQDGPALGTGRGEQIEALAPFPALQGKFILLVHPGFGISTPWAYSQLAHFPEALHGRAGRAAELVRQLQSPTTATSLQLYNSLEAPALRKYPILALYQEFFRAQGAWTSLMSGSGSSTFAIVSSRAEAERMLEGFRSQFGTECWTAVAPL